VRLLEVHENQSTVQLLLEYAGLMNLSDFLSKYDPSPAVYKEIFRYICEGIAYLHSKGISHRDLKPENIVVDDSLLCRDSHSKVKARIIDFGFAVEAHPSMFIRDRCGTPVYMSPELALRQPYQAPPADMWALGVLLYRMVYKALPFKSLDCEELYNMIVQNPVIFPKASSREGLLAQDLMQKLIQKQPSLRLTAMQTLAHPYFNST